MDKVKNRNQNINSLISSFSFGDMNLCYLKGYDLKGHEVVGLEIIPSSMKNKRVFNKQYSPHPLIQVKLIGDDYPFNYAHGRTMQNSESTYNMRYVDQTYAMDNHIHHITTYLKDKRGILYEHHIYYKDNGKSFRCNTRIINESLNDIELELLSSFTLGGITPFIEGSSSNALQMYQIRSTWSYEGRLTKNSIETYMLEPSWKPSGTNCIRFGQIGSMPNREYFPFVALEDTVNHVFWGVQLSTATSWQLEVYRKDDALNLSGGIADREKGQWIKKIKKGQSFQTPDAIISVSTDDIDDLCQRITNSFINNNIKKLPVVFNEFCSSWGNPNHKSIVEMVDFLENKGIDYFVIDCGWYKKTIEKNNKWTIQHGDWEINKELFPRGLKDTVQYIHKKGIKAGLWFEFETCGRESNLFSKNEYLYTRDGIPLTVGNRRFLDLFSEDVQNYLDEKVIKSLKDNQIDYLKIDYNDNLGIGIDGGDSLGERIYESGLKTLSYIKKIKKQLPGLMIENCSAGGHRLVEPFTSTTDISSFSDAHESECIPIIAANMHRMILPSQSLIWVVLHRKLSIERINYKIASSFLGVLCLSGNLLDLDSEQWMCVEKGIQFYKKASHIIINGDSKIIFKGEASYKEPSGYQIVSRQYNDELLIVIHTFEKNPQSIEVNLQGYNLVDSYNLKDYQLNDRGIIFSNLSDYTGIALLCRKKDESD